MKTLLLLRHAKSSWKDADALDFERPLNGRGKKAAPLVGRLLRERKIEPELILCSPAERARQTASLVVEAASLACAVRFDERIYEASAARLLEVVSQVEEEAQTLLLVGHNPGLEGLLALLTGETHAMPTAALACVALAEEKWGKLKEQGARLEWLTTPKELDGD